MARRAAGAVGTMAAAAAHTDRREDAHGRLSKRHERAHDPQRSSAYGILRCMLANGPRFLAFSPRNENPANFIHTLEVGGGGEIALFFLCAVEFNFAYSVVLICRSTRHTGHVSSNHVHTKAASFQSHGQAHITTQFLTGKVQVLHGSN